MPRGNFTITRADMDDTRTRATMHFSVSDDGGQTWVRIASGTWEGGPQTQKNGVTPSWGLIVEDVGRLEGKQTRFEPDIRLASVGGAGGGSGTRV